MIKDKKALIKKKDKVRISVYMEPDLADWTNEQAEKMELTSAAYIRLLIKDVKQTGKQFALLK